MMWTRPILFALLVLLGSLVRPIPAAESETERIARIDAMSSEEKAELTQKKNRFESLPEAERKRVRKLQAEIEDHPDAKALSVVMQRYHAWLKTLSPSQLADLRDLPQEERIAEIKRLKQEQDSKQQWHAFVQTARQASPEDLETVFVWLKEFVERRRSEILGGLPREFARRLERVEDKDRQTLLLIYLVLPHRFNFPVPRLGEEEVEELIPKLSQEMQRVFQEASDNGRRDQLIAIWSWGALWSKVFPNVSSAELAEFFTKLPAEERDRLEKLAAKDREIELKHMYARANFFKSGEFGERPWDRRDGRRSSSDKRD